VAFPLVETCLDNEAVIALLDTNLKSVPDAIGSALAMCRYATLQAPEFDEEDRLAGAAVEKKTTNSVLQVAREQRFGSGPI
jgi:hypothetical protein